MCGGWGCYTVGFVAIGTITMLVSDVASLLGCSLGLPNVITAITFVAIGTSLPDTFAAKIQAVMDKTADNSVGKVNGSNSVNVFLGLGLPWVIAAAYWEYYGATEVWKARVGPDMVKLYPEGGFIVRAGDLSFTIGVFFICCIICVGILAYRRRAYGAELGGPASVPTAIFLVLLWVVYVTASSLYSVGVIPQIF
jgi:solute carrier family 8 (sodium/calcium exchanger)